MLCNFFGCVWFGFVCVFLSILCGVYFSLLSLTVRYCGCKHWVVSVENPVLSNGPSLKLEVRG